MSSVGYPSPLACGCIIIFNIDGWQCIQWLERRIRSFLLQNNQNLLVENNTVIVPEGQIVEGDIVVKNGDLRIEGEVHGNVTIINGKRYLASAGNVTGDIQVINEVFEWVWYKMKEGGKKLVNLFE